MKIINIEKQEQVFHSSIRLAIKGQESQFHWIYLRDNCTCEKCYHSETVQRTLDTFNQLPWKIDETTLKAPGTSDPTFHISSDTDELVIEWPDFHISKFTESWLVNHSYCPAVAGKAKRLVLPPKVHWNRKLFEQWSNDGILFQTDYANVKRDIPKVLKEIYQYGFSFIRNVPVSLDATRRVSELISIIRPTHYDSGVWDFTSDLSKKDTAYTTLAIDLHVDGTYWHESPGLQLFHLLENESEGGETRIVDVAAVLNQLRDLASKDSSWERTLQILTNQKLEFHQSGESANVFFNKEYATLTLDENGDLEHCRWNTSDRVPQVREKNAESLPYLYEALFRFNSLINDPANYVQFQLNPGTILVFDNWRVLHARTAFTGKRRLCGSYLTRDDFIARLKSCYFDRDDVLNVLYE